MGDSVKNESAVAALNRMALLGQGRDTAYLVDSTNPLDPDGSIALANAFTAIVNDISEKNRSNAAVAVNSGSYNAGSAIYQAKFDADPIGLAAFFHLPWT